MIPDERKERVEGKEENTETQKPRMHRKHCTSQGSVHVERG